MVNGTTSILRHLPIAILIVVAFFRAPLIHADSTLEKQRELYRLALEDIRQGRIEKAERAIPSLKQYVLFPYLELELLKAQINDVSSSTIDSYLTQYRGTVVGDRIRHTWLGKLQRRGDWGNFIKYADGNPPWGMDCSYISALRATGRGDEANRLTAKLWQTGRSIPERCDPVLRTWLKELPPETREQVYWERAVLALKANETGLASYLLNKIPNTKPYRQLLAYPERLYRDGFTLPDNDFNRELVVATLHRLASADFDAGNTLWQQLNHRFSFNYQQHHDLRDSFARQIIAGDADYARDWINANDPDFQDAYLTEWRIRLALRDRDWQAAKNFIEALPPKKRSESDWQYWWARTDMEIHQKITDDAQQILRQLATERGYYSFLAADLLNQPYRLAEKRTLNSALLDGVADSPALQRARELYWQNDYRDAKLEWLSGLRMLSRDQQVAAAQLGLDWGWPYAAVMTAIKAGEWDDIELRFPLAFRDHFDKNAKTQNIDLKWVYAIARQESAFAQNATSPVGARGVMQLMPGTARSIAKDMGRSSPPPSSLENAELNIEMGSFYLAKLLEEFGGNRVLATAAYNAGPNRIKRVLKRQDTSLPADIWIENLPYGETREYIKNVMAFSVVYGIKLESSKPILASHERRITPMQALSEE